MNKTCVLRLFVSPAKGVCEAATDLVLTRDGIVGDCHGGDKQVSLCSAAAFASLGQGAALCAARYMPNVVLDGWGAFAVGDELSLGTARLRITGLKSCFPDDCALAASGAPCALKDGAAFARVIRQGAVSVGDVCKEESV